jgi:hypothetical protein
MARLDKIHYAVKNALIKDGWTITHDPFFIQFEDITVQADLGAERTIAAEMNGNKIAVEIKSFLRPSNISEFETALGQYRLYRRLLKKIDPERPLFLAVNTFVFNRFFTKKAIQFVIKEEDVSLIVVDILNEEVVKWLKN